MKKLLMALLLVPTLSFAAITNWDIKISKDEFSQELESFTFVSRADDGSYNPSKLSIKKSCAGAISVVMHAGDKFKPNTVVKFKATKGPVRITNSGKSTNMFVKNVEVVHLNSEASKLLLADMLKSGEVKVQGLTLKGLKTVVFPLGSFNPLFNLLNSQCK